MKIESLRIKNYKVFRDVSIRDLPNMAVFLGANGSGKSTLFDVFGFLHDALTDNIRSALVKRGGYKEVVSRGAKGPIEFEIKFRPNPGDPIVTYILVIEPNKRGIPVVKREVLKYRRGQKGQPWHFLDFCEGIGVAIVNEDEYVKPNAEPKREEQHLDSPEILAIKGLGQFQKFPQIAAFRRLIEGWYISDFHIQAARASQDAGYSEHLSPTGENLPLVAQFIYEHYPESFQRILQKMSERVPGVTNVQATETADGRIVLRFQDGSFKDPFVARFVSDGTIKMFAYLLLLNDPQPHPLLCIEEPENQLHPELLFELSEEFRSYSDNGGQVFISTHSPDFVNGIDISELFWLTKKDGFSIVQRAADNELVRNLVNERDLLGSLWKQGFFDGAGPR
ncbi:SMC domain protein [Desulfofarcimen acetoxidans DSM 771]|uniref:SMC domain protein n=1 Tax=Desulfofarcimen acetoxidans (strain ATCC 49208 / DSM 771 / KCTC 5769 / VKM B-1644 / 5575) TaxID=485916 RepID=C8W2N8_DESAS|nr:AAA family ATPase [Desulfofarcimen acetoxidans]ACV63722.1 SMC domain protein [Desulfofarcimen acetoxidans DSM 771]